MFVYKVVDLVLEQCLKYKFCYSILLSCQGVFFQKVDTSSKELENRPSKLMRNIPVLQENDHDSCGFAHEFLEAFVRSLDFVMVFFLLFVQIHIVLVLLLLLASALWLVQDNILLDWENERPDCATLSRGVITSKADKYYGEKLVYGIEFASH